MIFGAMTVRENLVLGACSKPARDIPSQFDYVLSVFPPLGPIACAKRRDH